MHHSLPPFTMLSGTAITRKRPVDDCTVWAHIYCNRASGRHHQAGNPGGKNASEPYVPKLPLALPDFGATCRFAALAIQRDFLGANAGTESKGNVGQSHGKLGNGSGL